MDTQAITALQTAYRYIYVNLFALARQDILIAPTITDAWDPRWLTMCDRYKAFVNQAPEEVRSMADSMMRVQIFEMEKMWRFIDEQKLDEKQDRCWQAPSDSGPPCDHLGCCP